MRTTLPPLVLDGAVAVITGAAGGLGSALARLGAARGMHLMLADQHESVLEALAGSLRGDGTRVETFALDVADAAQVEALAARTFDRLGVPQLVFNNAGILRGGLLWETSTADWEQVLGVNLHGVVAGIRAFVPAMIDAGRRQPGWRGHVVNTASMAGLVTPPNMGVYAVSKHAVVALTETLHHDLALVDAAVGASVLCPFFVPSGIAGEPPADGPASARVAQVLNARAVAGGRVSADDVARMTFDGVVAGQVFIHSHPTALDSFRERATAIAEGAAPADPFAGRPALWDEMRTALRQAGAMP